MPKIITTETFIQKAKEVRTDINFDYSKVNYINAHTKVTIIDPEYGPFDITPNSFLRDHGHPLRGGTQRLTTETFIQKAKEVRTDIDFDYSKVNYINSNTKVIIIDPEYGEFYTTPSNFLSGKGHKIRAIAKVALTTETFIAKAKQQRTDIDFDYSKVNYVNSRTKVTIIDPDFGEFNISPSIFLIGRGHPLRGGTQKLTTETFIKKAKEIRTDIDFDYSKVNYVNSRTKVIIIDPDFGEFNIKPNSFLYGGCGHPVRAGHNQKYSYLSLVLDNSNPIGIKYGIESIAGNRTIQQNRNSVYKIVRIKTFVFNTPEECKAAEAECKSIFQKENRKLYKRNGLITKNELSDGYTETTSILNIDKVIEIYKKYNGKEVDSN